MRAMSLHRRRGVFMVPAMSHRLAIVLSLAASVHCAQAFRGAVMPWTTYEAEDVTTIGITITKE